MTREYFECLLAVVSSLFSRFTARAWDARSFVSTTALFFGACRAERGAKMENENEILNILNAEKTRHIESTNYYQRGVGVR